MKKINLLLTYLLKAFLASLAGFTVYWVLVLVAFVCMHKWNSTDFTYREIDELLTFGLRVSLVIWAIMSGFVTYLWFRE